MRGSDQENGSLFSYISMEDRIAEDHPLRSIRKMVDIVLKEMESLFTKMYSHEGRPSIAPEKLLRAQILQILYTIRSERQLMEQLDYNMLESCRGCEAGFSGALQPGWHIDRCGCVFKEFSTAGRYRASWPE
jgi:hypothetical protein